MTPSYLIERLKSVYCVGIMFRGKLAAGVYLGILSLCLAGCSTSRICNQSFTQVEGQLLSSIHLEEADIIHSSYLIQAKVEGELARVMSKKIYAVELRSYEAGRRLCFGLRHDYDIGAVGGEYITFDLQRRASGSTRIMVDYCDRWAGVWPPFIFWNPGGMRESKILDQIFGAQ